MNIQDQSPGDINVRLIHFRHNTVLSLNVGQKFIFDPATGFGFERGERVVTAFNSFAEKAVTVGQTDVEANFVDIIIANFAVAFALDPGIATDHSSPGATAPPGSH